MNTQTVESPTGLPDELKGYANELAAAQKRLQAPASDLAILLDLILKKSITRDQLCDLLENPGTIFRIFEQFSTAYAKHPLKTQPLRNCSQRQAAPPEVVNHFHLPKSGGF